MTVWDTIAAIRRQWFAVLAAVLCTLIALQIMGMRPPVFYSRGEVRFLAPSSQVHPNTLQTTSTSLVVTAGIVAKRINGTHTPTRFSSHEATLVGRGTWYGTQISLVDNGVQWSPNYNTPALDVQVAADSPDEVVALRDELYTRIAAELEAVQDEYQVPEHNRITVQAVPNAPDVVSLAGRPRQAQAMTLILGVAAALTAVWALERRAIRRRGLIDPRPHAALVRAGT